MPREVTVKLLSSGSVVSSFLLRTPEAIIKVITAIRSRPESPPIFRLRSSGEVGVANSRRGLHGDVDRSGSDTRS